MEKSLVCFNHTPDHPPYAEMIRDAITTLDEEGGSNESSISSFIKATYTDLPVAHGNLLSYHLSKLTLLGEIAQPVPGLYTLPNFQTPVNPNPEQQPPALASEVNPNPEHQPLALASVKQSIDPSSLADPSSNSRRRGRLYADRSSSHKRGRPPKKKLPYVEEPIALLSGPPAIDGQDVPLRRRRGRPPKPKEHGLVGPGGVDLDGKGRSGGEKSATILRMSRVDGKWVADTGNGPSL